MSITRAIDQLHQLAADLISEVGGAALVPRRLTGKPWFVFTQMLSEARPHPLARRDLSGELAAEWRQV